MFNNQLSREKKKCVHKYIHNFIINNPDIKIFYIHFTNNNKIHIILYHKFRLILKEYFCSLLLKSSVCSQPSIAADVQM